MIDSIFHISITVGAIIITYLFIRGYQKTKNKNLLWLGFAFLILSIGYLSHLAEDYIKIEFWGIEHIDHVALVIVLFVLIWVLWPKSRWTKAIRPNNKH